MYCTSFVQIYGGGGAKCGKLSDFQIKIIKILHRMMVGDRSAYDYYCCCTWVMVVELALRENIPDLAGSSVKDNVKTNFSNVQNQKKIKLKK